MAQWFSTARLSCVLALAAGLALGQNRLTLSEAGARKEESFAPLHEGEAILVLGTVASAPIRLREYSHLVIHDDRGSGLTIEAPHEKLSPFRPGHSVEVEGRLANRAGLPVLQPERIGFLATVRPPEPVNSTINELNSFAHLGMLVAVESRVLAIHQNAGGETILLGGFRETPLRIFYPAASRAGAGELNVRPGDAVRVTGISSQYAPNPPYDRGFQLVVGSGAAFTVEAGFWAPSPDVVYFGIVTIALTLLTWWARERAMAAQRKKLRRLTVLAEEVIGTSSPAEISEKLTTQLPRIFRSCQVSLYLYNRHTETVDRVPTPADPEPFSVNIENPTGKMASAVARCFRNKAMLDIPDTRVSPVLTAGDDDDMPRSMLLAPMLAQQEMLGVIAIAFEQKGKQLSRDEQAATQHLANQVATSLKLQEQHSVREQLMRSEKMAAAGQMISGVVTELRGPLEAIEKTASSVLSHEHQPELEGALREVVAQANRGAGIVNRLVSFAKAEQQVARPLNIFGLINSLVEFREAVWRQKGVQVRNTLPSGSAMVLGDQGQLEQALLNLLVHAELSLAQSKEKTIVISTVPLGKRVAISIDYTDRSAGLPGAALVSMNGDGEALGLEVCQALISSHGGELRLLRNLPGGARFEIELPLHQAVAASGNGAHPPRGPAATLTAIIVEPDPAAQRRLIAFLSERGHRAVPVASAEHAIEMVHRLKFDVTFCSLRLPGLNWVEFYERIRRRTGAFVLLAEGYDSDLLQAFKSGDGFLLSKPIDEEEAERLMSKIEARQEMAAKR